MGICKMITVLYASFDEPLSEERWRYYISQVPPDIRNKILCYHRWQDRHAGLFGKLLLSEGLKRYGCSPENLNHLSYTAFGRPYINNSNLDFNISHSGQYVVCAITEHGKIGIDIEQIKPIDLSGFEKYMTLTEWEEIRQSEMPYHAFYSYWTKKESVLKACGYGLSVPLNKIVIDNLRAFFYSVEIQDYDGSGRDYNILFLKRNIF
ncbi:MAG: 4'-phosphopantetheinyl transferase superfamily protein [Desulfobacteraceae bacterium]|nr:4'-phosphopantetheinyl transferase superfamily protein [Desulfobacteraceae bacterium]